MPCSCIPSTIRWWSRRRWLACSTPSSYEGRRGHPAGFARTAWSALRLAPPDEGARAVLAAHPDWIVHVEGGPGCRAGINTPEDYRRLILETDSLQNG